jgi:cytochrome c biogenesis protein CcdA
VDYSISLAQLGLSLAAGSLSTLSPCVFPLLPMVMTGVAQAHHRAGPAVMGVGMVSAFVVVGIGVASVGPALGVDATRVRTVAGAMLVVVAAGMLVPGGGVRSAGWLSSLASIAQRLTMRLHPETLPGAFVLGGLLGIVWSPCSGPLLGSGIALAATSGGLQNGGLILGMFGVGAALPLVGVAYASRGLFARARRWLNGHGAGIRRAVAMPMALMGVLVLTGADRWIEAALLTYVPSWWLGMTAMF